jgi:hypothetical protein
MPDRPVGQFYGRTYLERGKPAPDSVKMRSRLAAFHDAHLRPYNDHLAKALHLWHGIEIRHIASYEGTFFDFADFYHKSTITDLLDAITQIWQLLRDNRNKGLAELWVKFVDIALTDENVAYEIDAEGGIHPRVDEEFQHNRAATVAALQAPRYRAALEQFEAAQAALNAAPPNGKNAIRDTFESVESIFKLMCGNPKPQRISAQEVRTRLKQIIAPLYGGNLPAQTAAELMCESLADWINAAHRYRHAPGEEEPLPPPLDVAVLMMSAGASWVRWLAELDARISSIKAQSTSSL